MDEDVPGRRWQGSGALYHDSSRSFMGRRPVVTIGIINKYVCKLHSMEFQIEVVYGSSSPPVRVGHTRRRPLQAVILRHPREKSRRRELISIMKFPGSHLRLREGAFSRERRILGESASIRSEEWRGPCSRNNRTHSPDGHDPIRRRIRIYL